MRWTSELCVCVQINTWSLSCARSCRVHSVGYSMNKKNAIRFCCVNLFPLLCALRSMNRSKLVLLKAGEKKTAEMKNMNILNRSDVYRLIMNSEKGSCLPTAM